MIGYNDDPSTYTAVKLRHADLRALAEGIRRAELAQGPRPWRRKIGHLLMATGRALASVPRERIDEFERRHAHA